MVFAVSSRIQVGQAAPPFKLYDTDRKRRTLREFKGKTLVLVFFPGAFTETCTKVLEAFRDMMPNFEAANAQLVAVSVNDPFTLAAFAAKHRIPFPLLSDYNRTAIRAYDVVQENYARLPGYTTAKRAVYVISPEGFVRYRWVTNNPRIEPPYSEIQHAIDSIHRPSP